MGGPERGGGPGGVGGSKVLGPEVGGPKGWLRPILANIHH